MRFLFAAVLVAALTMAVGAVAQIPDGLISQGPMLKVAALDTVWFTTKQYVGSSVVDFTTGDLPARLYPIRAKLPLEGGGFTEPILAPTAFHVYAKEPFYWKGFADGGDSLAVSHVYVDTNTVIGVAAGGSTGQLIGDFACETWIFAGLDTLRVTPTASDTVFVVPWVAKP